MFSISVQTAFNLAALITGFDVTVSANDLKCPLSPDEKDYSQG